MFSLLIFLGIETAEFLREPPVYQQLEFISKIDLTSEQNRKKWQSETSKNAQCDVDGYHLHKKSRQFYLPSSVSTFKESSKKFLAQLYIEKEPLGMRGRRQKFTIFYLLEDISDGTRKNMFSLFLIFCLLGFNVQQTTSLWNVKKWS